MEGYEDLIDEDDIKDQIKDWLYKMEDYGYDLRFVNQLIASSKGKYDKRAFDIER